MSDPRLDVLRKARRFLGETREAARGVTDPSRVSRWKESLAPAPKAPVASAKGESFPGLETDKDPVGVKFDLLFQKVSVCRLCHLGVRRRRAVRFGGALHRPVMVLVDHPEINDAMHGRLLAGEEGPLARKILSALDVPEDRLYFTGVLKCAATGHPGKLSEVQVCLGHLREEIRLLDPSALVGFGDLVLSLLFPAETPDALRGRPLEWAGRPFVGTRSLSEVLANPEVKKEVWADLKSWKGKLA